MKRLMLIAMIVLVGCASHEAQFHGRATELGDFDLVADRCYAHGLGVGEIRPHWESAQFEAEASPGLIVRIHSREALPGTSLLDNGLPARGVIEIVRADDQARAPIFIESSACDRFEFVRLREVSGYINHVPQLMDEVLVELSCKTPKGGRVEGKAHWAGFCS